MTEFLDAYGSWIGFGVFFLMMLWMHSGRRMHGSHGTDGGHADGHSRPSPEPEASGAGPAAKAPAQRPHHGC